MESLQESRKMKGIYTPLPQSLYTWLTYVLTGDIMKDKLIQEMNKINAEISGVVYKKRKWKEECNIMGCKNKPIHKFKWNGTPEKKGDGRIIFTCNKHKRDYDDWEGFDYVGEQK